MAIDDLNNKFISYNCPRSLHPFLASLLSAGMLVRVNVPMTGRYIQDNKVPEKDSTFLLTVTALAEGTETGDVWRFEGRLQDGTKISGFFSLRDGMLTFHPVG